MAENTTASTTANSANEGTNNTTASATATSTINDNNVPDYKAMFEKAVAERDRFKSASDNLSAENAAYKRKEREALSESERRQADEAEREQRFVEMQSRLTQIEVEQIFSKASIDEDDYKNVVSMFTGTEPLDIDGKKNLAQAIVELCGSIKTKTAELTKNSITKENTTTPPASDKSSDKKTGFKAFQEKNMSNSLGKRVEL